jgi:RNA polymerase-binding transcription factor DksA
MTSANLAIYRRQLMVLGNCCLGDVASLVEEVLPPPEGASGNLSHWPLHLADLATDAYERQCTLGLLEQETLTLAEIAAGLERIEQGTFGRCEGCRKAIPKARLQALPYARYCVECAENLSSRRTASPTRARPRASMVHAKPGGRSRSGGPKPQPRHPEQHLTP